MRLLKTAALFAACAALPAAAQVAPAPTDGGTSDEIVVRGSRTEIRNELGNLLNTTGGQLARFEDPLCPLIAGFDAEYSGYLRDLILTNAEEAGIKRGRPGCEPNAIVIFTDQPHALVQAMRERMFWAFGEMTLPARDRITKPVRSSYAWHANYVAGSDGRTANNASAVLGSGGLGGGFDGIPAIRAFTASRLYTPAVQVMAGAFLILDINKTPGMTLDQIADFATLNLLVDLDHDAQAQARSDSILKLFDATDPSRAAQRMSGFDRAMVKALYKPDNLSLPANRMRMQLAADIKAGGAGDSETSNPD